MHRIEKAPSTQHIANQINWTGNAHDSMMNTYKSNSILVCPTRKFSIRHSHRQSVVVSLSVCRINLSIRIKNRFAVCFVASSQFRTFTFSRLCHHQPAVSVNTIIFYSRFSLTISYEIYQIAVRRHGLRNRAYSAEIIFINQTDRIGHLGVCETRENCALASHVVIVGSSANPMYSNSYHTHGGAVVTMHCLQCLVILAQKKFESREIVNRTPHCKVCLILNSIFFSCW